MPRVNLIVAGGSTAAGRDDFEHGGVGGLFGASMMARTQERLIGPPGGPRRPIADVHTFAAHQRTLPYIVKHLPGFLETLEGDASAALVLVGASDARIPALSTEASVDIGRFRDSLSELGELCCRHHVLPVYMEFPPIDDKRARRLGSKIGLLSNELIAPYNVAIQEHAAATDRPFVATWEVMGAGDPGDPTVLRRYLGPDGIHQNTLGHQLLFDLSLGAVDEAIRQSYIAAA